MAVVLQASARVPDWERLREAVEWLHEEIQPYPEGFISFAVMREAEDPERMTILEEWESPEAFQRAFERYDQTHRATFLDKAGIDAEQFERAMWLTSDIPTYRG